MMYSCNAATEVNGTSFIKEWYKHGLGQVTGALNRTEYSYILGKTDDEKNYMLNKKMMMDIMKMILYFIQSLAKMLSGCTIL